MIALAAPAGEAAMGAEGGGAARLCGPADISDCTSMAAQSCQESPLKSHFLAGVEP